MWTLSYHVWDLVPSPWIKPRSPVLGAQILSHQITQGKSQDPVFKATWKINMFYVCGKRENSEIHGSFQELWHKRREGKGICEAVFVSSGLLLSLSRVYYFLGSRKGTEASRDLEQKGPGGKWKEMKGKGSQRTTQIQGIVFINRTSGWDWRWPAETDTHSLQWCLSLLASQTCDALWSLRNASWVQLHQPQPSTWEMKQLTRDGLSGPPDEQVISKLLLFNFIVLIFFKVLSQIFLLFSSKSTPLRGCVVDPAPLCVAHIMLKGNVWNTFRASL